MSHADGKGKNVPVLRSVHLQLYVRLTSDAVVSKYLKRYGLNISEQSQYAATSPNSLQPRILLFLKCHAEKDNENRSKGQRLGNTPSLMLNKILKQAQFSRTCGKIELALTLYFSFNLQISWQLVEKDFVHLCFTLTPSCFGYLLSACIADNTPHLSNLDTCGKSVKQNKPIQNVAPLISW